MTERSDGMKGHVCMMDSISVLIKKKLLCLGNLKINEVLGVYGSVLSCSKHKPPNKC